MWTWLEEVPPNVPAVEPPEALPAHEMSIDHREKDPKLGRVGCGRRPAGDCVSMAIGDYVIRIDTLSVRHDSAEIELGHSGS